MNPNVLLAIPLLPLCAAILAGLAGKWIGRTGSHVVTIAAVGASFVLSAQIAWQLITGEVSVYNDTVYTWLVSDGIRMEVGFLVDQLSVLMMCFGSLMIAVLPTYDSIGIAAPILLLAARLLQGLSVGGEYGTSATYLSEVATAKHRGFFSSFQYDTLIGGQLLALVAGLGLGAVLALSSSSGGLLEARDEDNEAAADEPPCAWSNDAVPEPAADPAVVECAGT